MMAFNCDLQLHVVQVCCGHAGLVPGGDVFLRLTMMSSTRHTGCVAACFPLIFRQHFWFNQVFVNTAKPAVVCRLLEEQPVRLELVQVTQEEIGGRLLAAWEGQLCDLVSAHEMAVDSSAPSSSSQSLRQLLMRTSAHLLDDCTLIYSITLNVRNRPHGRHMPESSVPRHFPAAVHHAYSNGPVAGRPTVLEPPLNLFDGPSEPNVVVVSEGAPTSLPVSNAPPSQEESSSIEPADDGRASHSWDTCPRRSNPPAAEISLSPLGPHRTLLHAPLPRSATGLPMATAQSAYLTSLCKQSQNCRRGQGFAVRHADDCVIQRRDFCQAGSRLPTNPVVQFLDNARHRAASPPPSAPRQGLERSPLRRTRPSRPVHGHVQQNSSAFQHLHYEEEDGRRQQPSRDMSAQMAERLSQQEQQPEQHGPRRSVTFTVSPPPQRRRAHISEPRESTLTSGACQPPSTDAIPLIPIAASDSATEHLEQPKTSDGLGVSSTLNNTHPAEHPVISSHSSPEEEEESRSSLSDGLSVSDLSDVEPASSNVPGMTSTSTSLPASSSQQPVSCAPSYLPSSTFTPSAALSQLHHSERPPRESSSFARLVSSNPTASRRRSRPLIGSVSHLSGHSQFLLDKMQRQGHELERMSQELQQRVDLLLQTCCGRSQARSPEDVSRRQSCVDTENLEELRSSLHSARASRLRQSARHIHQGTVDLGNDNYWSARMAEYTGRPHRLLFDETLEKVYSRLYERAQHIR